MSTNPEYSIRENRTLFGVGAVVAGRVARWLQRLRREALLALRRSRQRARLRRDLVRMEARQFHDIGLTRADLEAEAAKPFWRR